jgi:hypothetical protein
MSSPNDRVGEYSRVDKEESSFENETDYFIPDANTPVLRRRQSKIWKWLKISIWVGQAVLLAANIYGLTVIMKTIDRESAISKLGSWGIG